LQIGFFFLMLEDLCEMEGFSFFSSLFFTTSPLQHVN